MQSQLLLVLLLLCSLLCARVNAVSNFSRQSDQQQILFPSQGDLLLGRVENLNANSTCGEDQPIHVCPIGGAPCFNCDSRRSHDRSTSKDSYRLENAIGKIHNSNSTYKTWWLSKPGDECVMIELNLENKFTFTHLIMIFRGYRPKAWFLERSSDYGETFKPYAYFAERCQDTFPEIPVGRRQKINDVVCSSDYTEMTPSDKGQVVFNSVPQDIYELDTFRDTNQELWRAQTEITNLRIHLVKYHRLTDDKLHGSNSRYYYGLYEMNVHGMCICNGHATMCKPVAAIYGTDRNMVHSQCECMHNTQGPHCDQCLDFYNDRKWAPATLTNSNECRRCQCHGHTNRCVFSQSQWERTGGLSGGQCLDCGHNTTGDHCEKCEAGFYRDDRRTLEDPDVCVACDCFKPGIRDELCEQETNKAKALIAGHCFCKANVAGRRCDRCKPGFWNLQANNSAGCVKCGCVLEGTVGNEGCNQYTGQCPCKVNVEGETCNRCKPGYYNLSMSDNGCSTCDCDIGGSLSGFCNQLTGSCKCKIGFEGRRCDKLSPEFYVPRFDIDGSIVDVAESPDSSRFPRVSRPEEKTLTGRQGLRLRSPTQRTPDALTIPLGSRTAGLPTGTYVIVVKLYPVNVSRPLSLPTQLTQSMQQGGLETPSPECSSQPPVVDSSMRVLSTTEFLRQQQLTGPLDTTVSRPYTVLAATPPVCIDGNGMESLKIDVSAVQPSDYIIIDAVIVMPNWDSPIAALLNRTQHVPGRGSGQPQPVTADKSKSMETSLYNCLDYWKSEQQVAARMTDECRSLMQSLSSYRLSAALRCSCNPTGTVKDQTGILFDCDKLGGQCPCLPNVIRRTCSECAANHYGLGQFPNEGCRPCGCSVLGSLNSQCDTVSGECACQATKITGRQCDSCHQGFWEFPNCRACQCNGLAADCDKVSGVCLNCSDNTGGRECQDCSQGFYGDPQRRIPCRPCRCPGGRDGTVQHAATCQLRSESPPTPVCNCLPGYVGDSCERCEMNFYGDPSIGVCTRCSCNGNIDFNVPNSCDATNGMCIKCLNYTTGVSCELCQQGFYGQATVGQCRPCRCNPMGTEPSKALAQPVRYSAGGSLTNISHSCDGSTGQCSCLPNVEGINCDACKPMHYNFTSGLGCSPCDCDPLGSASDMCNVVTGQCPCKSNRGGRRCDQCLDLFYGDPARGRDGCQPCNCHPEGSLTPRCDKTTGRCVCKSAITGRQCDSCERGTTGTLPNCTTCGECWYNWDKIIASQQVRAQELKSRAEWAAKTGNMAGDLGAIVNETDKLLMTIWTSINETQVSIDQVTEVRDRINQLRRQENAAMVLQRAVGLSQQLNIIPSDGLNAMREVTDSVTQAYLKVKRRLEQISSYPVVTSNLPLTEELMLRLSLNESRFDTADLDFTEFNKTIVQRTMTALKVNDARLAGVVSQVGRINSSAQTLSDSISKIYKSIEERLPELNRIMCVGHNGENASLYSRNRNFCSELCGGPSIDICSGGDVNTQCAESSVCDKSVVAQLRSLAANLEQMGRRIAESMSEVFDVSMDQLNQRIATSNVSSIELAESVNTIRADYDNLKSRAQQLDTAIDSFLKSNRTTANSINQLVDSIGKATNVFSNREVEELATRLMGLLEKLPREHNITKINEDARQAREDVSRLSLLADGVMSETKRLDQATELTRQLTAAQAGIEPSRNALESARTTLDDLSSSTNRTSAAVSSYNSLVDQTNQTLAKLQARRATSQRESLEERIGRLRAEQEATARDLSAMDQKLNATLSAEAAAAEINPLESQRRVAILDRLRLRLETALLRVGNNNGLVAGLRLKVEDLEQSMTSSLARLASLMNKLNEDEKVSGSLAQMSASLERALCKARN